MTNGDRPFDIRDAKADDIAAFANIYEHYVIPIVATFMEARPTRPGWKHGSTA